MTKNSLVEEVTFKHYRVNVFAKKITKAQFLHLLTFFLYRCGTDFLNKLMKVVNEIAPNKEIRIKNDTQEWFDREIAELIHVREKLFLKFKKSNVHIDEENYKKVEH